ncbi:hypothetical protein Goklo_001441 [Gossypium klotzschianum]|uniref:Uncharacterized protein n=1 Tax=Gossypium klotzschianum TaxID=34286 RepID=A0A7J8W0X8_9ROSI|nr:hypothetical protein [Gossypium klotzschianum]
MDDIEVGELCDSDDSGRLDSAHESDSNGQNWHEFNLDNDMSNPKLQVGMLFKSKNSIKEADKQYGKTYFLCYLLIIKDMQFTNLFMLLTSR